jgi:hypothetical protein
VSKSWTTTRSAAAKAYESYKLNTTMWTIHALPHVHQQVANELMTTTAKEQFGSSCLCRRSPLRCDRLAAVSASRRRGALITLLMTLT